MATPPNPRKQQQRPRQPPSLQKVERYGQGGRGRGGGGGGGGANIHQSLTAQIAFLDLSSQQTQTLKQTIPRIQGMFLALCGIAFSNNKQQIIAVQQDLKPPSQNLKSSIKEIVTGDVAEKWHTILCFQYLQKIQKQSSSGIKDILKTYVKNVVETTHQKLTQQISDLLEGKAIYFVDVIAAEYARQIMNCVTLQLTKELYQKYGDC
jgi:hypothetical protein